MCKVLVLVNDTSEAKMVGDPDQPATDPRTGDQPMAASGSPAGAAALSALDAVNRLLAASSAEPPRLSDLLRAAGFTDAAITSLRRERLAPYLHALTEQLCAWIPQAIPERTAAIFIRRIGLDGEPPATLAALGEHHQISRERVRQLEGAAARRLRSRHSRAAIAQIIAETARAILGLQPADDAPAEVEDDSAPGEPFRAPRSAGPSALATLARFEAGRSPAAIAAERGIAESTVYSHLAACIRSGFAGAARAVTPTMVAAVRAALAGDEPPTSFGELRSRVPATLSPGQLMCVMAAHPELRPEAHALTPDAVRRAQIAIRGVVADCSGELPRSGVIRVLTGSASRRIAGQRDHPGYGLLAGYDRAALWQIIDDLIQAGDLALDDRGRLVYGGAPPRSDEP